ncbi:hypothetical protein [Psychroserpens damuponensis]|uniref:hypothetical protein n=1 Tax=Psychroserpens damuponensis TaxID=943936 RepID=UPI00058ABE16|nr:hypothetical protein [Psychroserpens damuponensis]
MKEFIKKYEIWVFLVLGPAFNLLFVYARYLNVINSFVYRHGRFCVLLLFLICLVKFTRGNEGIKDIFKPMLNWRVKPKWYIFSLVFAFLIGILTLMLKGLYFGDEFYTYIKVEYNLNLRAILMWLIWAFLGEVVWVSYCIRQLLKVTTPFYASQIVGVSWTLWFIPIALLGEGILPGIPVISLLIFMLGVAGMCTVVYVGSKSGVCVLLLQHMINISLNILLLSPSRGGVATFTAYSVIYFLVMLIFMYFMNPSNKLKTIRTT